MTSKELVYNTLSGKNTSRAARDLWVLPWAERNFPKELKEIYEKFPCDIVGVVPNRKQGIMVKGDAYSVGEYIDAWGAVFMNVHDGIIGEVKSPIIVDEDWNDYSNVHIPYELLDFDVLEVNKKIASDYKDKFVLSEVVARPFERLQFLRGTENLYVDLMLEPSLMYEFIEKMQDYYLKMIEKWCQTDVDGIFFMDDWGSQNSLLINPQIWDRVFRPLYQSYIDLAHKYGKKAFMHSDGNTLSIIPRLIEMGLDAFNCQIFCMGAEKLKPYKGKITFWGEIDRQHILVNGTKNDVDNAVEQIYNSVYDNGYAIAQCEFGAGANPKNVLEVYNHWNKITEKN